MRTSSCGAGKGNPGENKRGKGTLEKYPDVEGEKGDPERNKQLWELGKGTLQKEKYKLSY